MESKKEELELTQERITTRFDAHGNLYCAICDESLNFNLSAVLLEPPEFPKKSRYDIHEHYLGVPLCKKCKRNLSQLIHWIQISDFPKAQNILKILYDRKSN